MIGHVRDSKYFSLSIILTCPCMKRDNLHLWSSLSPASVNTHNIIKLLSWIRINWPKEYFLSCECCGACTSIMGKKVLQFDLHYQLWSKGWETLILGWRDWFEPLDLGFWARWVDRLDFLIVGFDSMITINFLDFSWRRWMTRTCYGSIFYELEELVD